MQRGEEGSRETWKEFRYFPGFLVSSLTHFRTYFAFSSAWRARIIWS